MSSSNGTGVIRIGRKGKKKFAFGEGPAFEVDVVVAFQQWIALDESFRPQEENEEGGRPIATTDMPAYHQAAVDFVAGLADSGLHAVAESRGTEPQITTAEALDFIARLREQYDELAVFFRPKSRDAPASPATSEAGSELRFSAEPGAAAPS